MLSRGSYHEGSIGVGIVVSQVAGILTVRELDHKGEGIKMLLRCSPHDSGALAIMISKRERKREKMRERFQIL